MSPDGRDSLGRGLDAGSIAAAVAADRAVQREREALPHYLAGAYRDPYAAKAQLDEMVKRQGWASTATRIAHDPTQLGELRGRVGLFAGAKARAERHNAEQVVTAIAPSLERIATAEARAAQTYRPRSRRSARQTPCRSPSSRRVLQPWSPHSPPRTKKLVPACGAASPPIRASAPSSGASPPPCGNASAMTPASGSPHPLMGLFGKKARWQAQPVEPFP